MESHIQVRKVTQDVLMFVWFKHEALSEEPVRDIYDLITNISAELMNNLSASVWIESFRSLFIWDDFFEKHFQRMTSSSKLFANYVAYVFYVLNESTDGHECFFDTLSFVTDVSLRCLERDQKPYLNTCVDLFCTFFEKELRTKFENQGGWKKFNEYLEKQYNLIESTHKSSDELFKYFQDARERGDRPDREDSCGILYKRRTRPHYVVNGIVIKDITQAQVETHEKSVIFAELVRHKMEKLLQQTFHEITKQFSETCNQVKELHQWTVVGGSHGIAKRVKHSFMKKEVSEHISSKTKVLGSKIVPASKPLKTRSLDTINTLGVVVPVETSHLKQKSTKREMAKTLLDTISEDIAKLFELFQPQFEEYGLDLSGVMARKTKQSVLQKPQKSSDVIDSAVKQSSSQKVKNTLGVIAKAKKQSSSKKS